MTNQSEKYRQAMSGEFFVAAQIQRLGLNASVTYGNAKRADVVVFSPDHSKCTLVEVKTTNKDKWAVGCPIPPPSKQPWVFVYLPEDSATPPDFYVLSQQTLHELLLPIQNNYFAQYEEKHGEPYGNRPGNFSLTRTLAEPYRSKWETITTLVKN